ncbi:MAG: DNA-binding protein [Candidatus Komeilibacteria bacterium]|nr:DNA-binding protein [Candidatus Komeilibacteria bacterium]
MNHKQITPSKQYLIKVNRSEEVITELTKFCQENNIFSGSFYGLGACGEAELGHYSVVTKQYSKQVFTGEYEVTNLTGIITDKKIHAHATMADNKFQTYAGHLARMVISGACEIHLIAGSEPISRKLDEETGLELLNI